MPAERLSRRRAGAHRQCGGRQNQHDVYGSMILAATPMFFDRRLPRQATNRFFHPLEPLGEQAAKLALEPDAGIWEYRGRKRIHTHSAAMCWAGCQRLEAIAAHLGLTIAPPIGAACRRHWRRGAGEGVEPEAEGVFGRVRLRRSRRQRAAAGRSLAWYRRRSAFRLNRRRDRAELRRDLHVMRYSTADDFGLPETAFLICRFWLIDALWAIGRQDEARDMFVDALECEIDTAFCRRTFIRRPENCGAIFRKPIRWQD